MIPFRKSIADLPQIVYSSRRMGLTIYLFVRDASEKTMYESKLVKFKYFQKIGHV